MQNHGSIMVWLVVALLAARLDVSAQSQSGLSGLAAVDLVVEEMENAARTCNLSGSGVDAAVRLPVDSSRLRIARYNRMLWIG